MRFEKTPKTSQEHIDILLSRGLKIPDHDLALRYLRTIGYYRLSAYFLPFQRGDHTAAHHEFLPDVAFGDILSLYIFDRKLRLILFDALERIEIAIRAAMTDTISTMTNNAHWHLNPENFGTRFGDKYSRLFNHGEFLAKISDEDDVFLKHYRLKYKEPQQPPAWMAFQVLSFGTCSFALAHLKKRQAVAVCKEFDLAPIPMISWVQGLCVLRNHCAHHARIWNRLFTHRLSMQGDAIPPTLIAGLHDGNQRSIEGYISVLDYFMQQANPHSHWRMRLSELIGQYFETLRHGVIKEKIIRAAGNWWRGV